MRAMLKKHGFEMVETHPHTQRLELGYVLHRAGDVLGAPMRMLSKLANAAGAGRSHVAYRLGQTSVAARRLP